MSGKTVRLNGIELAALDDAAGEIEELATDTRLCNARGSPTAPIWDSHAERNHYERLKGLAASLRALKDRAA